MKRIGAAVLLLGMAVGTGYLAYSVWVMPGDSNVALFRIVMVGFIPLPIPIGFLTSPHFWGGVLFLLAGGIGFAGVKRIRD